MSADSAARVRRARDLFLDLVDLDERERAQRLAALGDDDPALAGEVAALLRADSAAGAFLDEPAGAWLSGLSGGDAAGGAGGADGADDGPEDDEAEEGDGADQQIGSYRTISRLGRGGMGEVFLAERTDGQFEQRVALKVLRRGLDSGEIVARFLRERQILARLAHPNIARLLDGGLAPDGRPFFALEHVDGSPITDYCREHALPVPRIVALVAACCDAVDAAHRNLVVHRDLKPSNILVTRDGQVKLLDFGIAKLLEDDSDATTTRSEMRVLTPDYAAPEQILGEPVTTATDVYALGLVLHELLTGTLPHERGARSLSRLLERTTSDAPPERPSTLVRRAGGPRAARRVSGDLDTIVLTALRREPARRYASAAALGDDLRRHLAGLPVRARPDTLRYRAGKFVRRHRVGVVAAGLALLSLVAGLGAAVWQAQRAALQARRAERVIEVLVGIFEAADPQRSGGRSMTAQEIVDEGTARIERDLAAEPEVQADLFEALARIRRSLGDLDRASALATRSIALHGGEDAPAAAPGLTALGSAQLGLGRLDEAAATLEKALALLARDRDPDDLALARARNVYANALYMKGQTARAEELQRGVYETYRRRFGDDRPETAEQLRDLAVLLLELERLDEAEQANRSALATIEAALGPDHPNVASSLHDLGVLLDWRRKHAEAEPLLRRALEIRIKTLGPQHLHVGETSIALAQLLTKTSHFDEAVVHARSAIEIYRAIDENHLELPKALNQLGVIDSRRGHFAEAEQTMREVVRRFDAALADGHPFRAQSRVDLAVVIGGQGRLAEAESLIRDALTRLAPNADNESQIMYAREMLSEVRALQGAVPGAGAATAAAEAVELQQSVLAWAERTFQDGDLRRVAARLQLALALLAADDVPTARATIDAALPAYAKYGPGTKGEAEAMMVSAQVALREKDFARAEREARPAVERLEKRFGPDHWRLFLARGVLGLALAGNGKTGEGLPLVDSARSGLAQRLGAADPRTRMF